MGEDTIVAPNTQMKIDLKSRVKDTFPLKANYRDPFEGTTEKPVVAIVDPSMQQMQQQPVKLPPPPPRPHQWPKVKYYGIVQKNTSKKPLCIVNIDDMLFNLREGDYILDGYMIKTVYRDSVVIQYKKQKRCFKK